MPGQMGRSAFWPDSGVVPEVRLFRLPSGLRWERMQVRCRRPGFHPWVGKFPQRRAWQATPLFLPGESHGQRSLAGLQSMGSRRVRWDWVTSTFTSHLLSSVHFSRSVMSYSWWYHGQQHTRLPCPSPTTRDCSNPHPLSRWCRLTISASVVPFSSCPPIPPSIRVFSNESTLWMRWPKYWSFSLSISPSNEHPGLISFRMDWLDLLAVQGTLKSLFQHHSSKAPFLQCSAFFTFQLSQPSVTTAVILQPKITVCHCFHCFPNCLPWSDGTRCHDHSFLNVEF